MVIGFTGTQIGMTDDQYNTVRELVKMLNPKFVNHGDCIGADAQFHGMCQARHISIMIHPPIKDNKRAFCNGAEYIYRPLDYLDRNKCIVNQSDILIATPSRKEELRSGTWSTIRYARKINKPHIIIMP